MDKNSHTYPNGQKAGLEEKNQQDQKTIPRKLLHLNSKKQIRKELQQLRPSDTNKKSWLPILSFFPPIFFDVKVIKKYSAMLYFCQFLAPRPGQSHSLRFQ